VNDQRLMRLRDEECEMLEAFRALPQDYQDHLLQLAEAMLKHVQATNPSNVILLSDPFRKFR
jgi:predicted nucleotide-binding protein (sugar kinase/HSP70/actin superfamily)